MAFTPATVVPPDDRRCEFFLENGSRCACWKTAQSVFCAAHAGTRSQLTKPKLGDRRCRQPTVQTLEPQDAHPLYLEWVGWKTRGLALAAKMAREGYREGARLIRGAIDGAARAGDQLPRK